MGRFHKTMQRLPSQKLQKKIVGEKTYDSAHFIGTGLEKQYDATKAAEQQARDVANAPTIPLADTEELKRIQRRKGRGGGRASTVLSDDERLGG